jgi:DNA processing protein
MTSYSQEQIDMLRLYRSERIGPMIYRQLLRQFGNAHNALKALPNLAKKAGGKRTIKAIPESNIIKELEDLTKMNGRVIFDHMIEYPHLLKHISDAPPMISVIGRDELLHENKPKLAIIGARNASSHGLALARRYGEVLGNDGYVIVSGLALGTDGAAHEGALESQSSTIAVLAGGIDHIYPKQHKNLYHHIAENGLLVSEMPLGMTAQARHFPRRNRIVSGLSLGVLVIEASIKSGSLITANLALEQGRDVFAVPGSPTMPNARGCNKLIKEGAYMAETPDDILPILERSKQQNHLHETSTPSYDDEMMITNTEDHDQLRQKLLELLSISPTNIDQLAQDCQCHHAILRACLVEMALAGQIEWRAGDHIILNSQQQIEDLF